MRHLMAKFWWILAVRGILGMLLGTATLVWLWVLNGSGADVFGLSLYARWASIVATLILFLGLYAFLDGLFAVFLGIQDYGDGRRWWALIAEGLLSLALGLAAWMRLDSVLVLLNWIILWAVLTGFLELLQAFDLNEYQDRSIPLFLAGLSSLLFGLLAFHFRFGGMNLAWLLGGYAFTFSIPLLVLAYRLRPFTRGSSRS